MQTLISRYIFLTLIFTHTLFGCALCTIYSPQTKFFLDIKVENKKINTIDVTWVLTKDFTNQLKEIYDKNQNNFLDKDELQQIGQSLYDYIIPKNYLTQINYKRVNEEDNYLDIDVISSNLYVKNSILHFDYSLKLDLLIDDKSSLNIKINDDENYFVLVLQKKLSKIDFENVNIIESNDEITFDFSNTLTSDNKIEEIKEFEVDEKIVEETLLEKFVNKVKDYLVRIEQGDNFALLILLGVSFIYGILHALGPGHGKSLAFSYFLVNKSSIMKAFFISQGSAFIHIIGALVMVIVSVFILESVLNNFVNDSIEILTKTSAIMIMALAVYILYNKLTKNSCSCSSCCSKTDSKWSVTKPSNQSKLKPNFMKQDLYFVLTAGLIPCPGTVVLFIYAFILKTYFAVFLAAISISLGMGLVIFLSSYLGVSLSKISSKSHKITNIIEIIAPIFIFIFGVLLFLNANIF